MAAHTVDSSIRTTYNVIRRTTQHCSHCSTGATSAEHASFGVGAASAGVLLLLVATALCMWWHRRRKSAPDEAADKEQLRKDLLHAHDSVVVAKKRITGGQDRQQLELAPSRPHRAG
jgi:hypothetical protein